MTYVSKKEKTEIEQNQKKYKCNYCGGSWKSPDKRFGRSRSELYSGNDGYLDMCNDCRIKYYEQLIEKFDGNERLAIDRLCQKFDWYFSDDCFDSARSNASSNRNVLSNYASRIGMPQYTKDGNSYSDTIIERESKVELKNDDESGVDITSSVELWGSGIFSDEDYKILNEHYKVLKASNHNCDSNQEILIKSLCQLDLLRIKALNDKNTKDYMAANREYAATFKLAGLKAGQDEEKNSEDCWGSWMEMISQYTPEEYYKDKKLYSDFDKIGSQFERFVLRPLKNLITKTNDRDSEYRVDGD